MRLINDIDNQWLMNYENRLLFELYVAYLEARKGGKRGTFDEHKFEVNEFENLISLRDSLIDKTYVPSRGTAHIIHNPVIREIFAALLLRNITDVLKEHGVLGLSSSQRYPLTSTLICGWLATFFDSTFEPGPLYLF